MSKISEMVNYQTQTTGTWSDPTGETNNGRIVIAYNSTLDEKRIYTVVNGVWESVELLG